MISFINGTKQINVKQDVAITKQVATFFEFKIKGDYSINFEIENNSVNREALGIYNISQTDNLRQDWELYSESNKIAKGELIVQRIKPNTIELFFISGNANWIGQLIESTVDLDLLRYGRSWDYAAITARGRDYGIVYPLADWAYSFDKCTAGFRTSPIVDSGDSQFADFYPCFYYKDLLKEVIQQSGFKLAGDILNDTRYQRLIITPANAEINRNEVFVKERNILAFKDSTQTVGSANTYTKVTFNDILDASKLWIANTYTTDTNYIFSIKCLFSVSVDQAYTAALYVDGVLSETKTFSGIEAVCEWTNLQAIKNRTFEIYLKSDSGGAGFNININSKIEINPDILVIPRQVGTEYVYPNDFIQLNCIDVIKFITVYFGCYVYFDEYSKTIYINRIDKIIQSEDWSEYIKDYEAIYDARQATNNYLRLAEPVDENIILYNSVNKTGFGEGNFTTDTDLNESNELYIAPFAAAESRVTIRYGQLMLPYIGLVQLEDENEYSEYTTVTDATNVAQFNGDGFNLAGGEVVRVVDASGTYSGYHVVSATNYSYFQSQGMGYKGDSSGIFYKQKANFTGGKNRILLYQPDVAVSSVGSGDTGGSVTLRHLVEMQVTDAVSPDPVYQVQFTNSLYNETLSTTGTATNSGQLAFVDNVTAYVSRTGNAADQVIIEYYRNGVLEASETPISAGNPVNENYTYTSVVSTDDFKVVITEG